MLIDYKCGNISDEQTDETDSVNNLSLIVNCLACFESIDMMVYTQNN